MLQQGFLARKTPSCDETKRRIPLCCRVVMGTGVGVMIGGLTYMLSHLDHADALIGLWFPLVIAGVAMVCISLVVGLVCRSRPVRVK